MIRTQTPEEALFELGQHAVDAVVASLPLPGMGFDGLYHALRTRRRTPMLVTTSAGAASAVDALLAGADDHITLPCDERVLRARLNALIRRVHGPLSPQRIVTVGELTIGLDHGTVVVEPALRLTGIQATVLGDFAASPGALLTDAALHDHVRAVHGPTSREQLDAALYSLQIAVAVASGIADAMQRIDHVGWRLAANGLAADGAN